MLFHTDQTRKLGNQGEYFGYRIVCNDDSSRLNMCQRKVDLILKTKQDSLCLVSGNIYRLKKTAQLVTIDMIVELHGKLFYPF